MNEKKRFRWWSTQGCTVESWGHFVPAAVAFMNSVYLKWCLNYWREPCFGVVTPCHVCVFVTLCGCIEDMNIQSGWFLSPFQWYRYKSSEVCRSCRGKCCNSLKRLDFLRKSFWRKNKPQLFQHWHWWGLFLWTVAPIVQENTAVNPARQVYIYLMWLLWHWNNK